MAIAGALVVPANRACGEPLREWLESLASVEVQGVGPSGIAVVLEGGDPAGLKKISEQIRAWEEVLDFQLAYLNRESG